MLRHIFCDLDGTLYNGEITEKDIEAIKFAKDNGITFSIATGRVFDHCKSIIEDVDVDGYLICENGSYIFDRDHKCIYKGTISDSNIKKIIKIFRSLDYVDPENDVIYFKYNGQIVLSRECDASAYFSKGYSVDEMILDKDTYEDSVGNIGVLSYDMDKLKMMVAEFASKLSEFDVYISSETTLNIVPKGISKFEAIKNVCKREGISLNEVVTIGDSPNDISMLQNIDISFSMYNSVEEVKASASFETPSVSDAIKMVIDLNNEEQE